MIRDLRFAQSIKDLLSELRYILAGTGNLGEALLDGISLPQLGSLEGHRVNGSEAVSFRLGGSSSTVCRVRWLLELDLLDFRYLDDGEADCSGGLRVAVARRLRSLGYRSCGGRSRGEIRWQRAGFTFESDDAESRVIGPELASNGSRLFVADGKSNVGSEQLCNVGELVGG